MSKAFFDDDLLRDSSASSLDSAEFDDDIGITAISEIGLSKLAKQRDEVNSQVAGAVQKIEHLRNRQHSLEREKNELEELGRKQEEYESGKKEMLDNLSRWTLLLKKEHTQAERMVALLEETSERFKESLSELKNIDESRWSDEDFRLELNRALVKVDIARQTYSKAMAKIEAASWHKQAVGSKPFDVVREAKREMNSDRGFGYWLMVGIAVTMPLIVTLIALFVAWRYFPQGFGI